MNVTILSRNVKVLAEGLARHIYELTCEVCLLLLYEDFVYK